MQENTYDFGMIGLGTMGRNLLLNMADHGFKVAGYDRDPAKITLLNQSATPGTTVTGAQDAAGLVSLLARPRKLMMLVPAGPVVDAVIRELVPLLEAGDILIDGGNSHYTDTLRRVKELKEKNIHFMGMGVSGGEQGARNGPSIMPGGDPEAWEQARPVLEAVAARVNNEPCVAYMGRDAAGHYVKMVHNGIEYAIMQQISEVYDILKRGGGLTNKELHQVFDTWNKGEMQSFLVEITADIFQQRDELTGNDLVDMIADRAGSKGTGKWTSQDAMDLPVPVPGIDMAVSMRDLSTLKEERVLAAALYKPRIRPQTNREKLVQQLHDGLICSTLISYAQGLAMLYRASAELNMDIPLNDVIRIWRGGCIIRSSLLDLMGTVYIGKKQPPNILLAPKVAALVKKKRNGLRNTVKLGCAAGIPVSGLSASLGYLDAYCSEQMPVNLIQAQRDYFGAHTYLRNDREGVFHTEWNTGA